MIHTQSHSHGIPPKLLLETVEKISIPLAKVFNLSLNEGVVPFEWKEANIISLFMNTRTCGRSLLCFFYTNQIITFDTTILFPD